MISRGQTLTIKIAKEKANTFNIADFYNLIGKDSSGLLTGLINKYSHFGHLYFNPEQCNDGGIGLVEYLPKDDKIYFGFCFDRFGIVRRIGIFLNKKTYVDNHYIKKQLKDQKFSVDAGQGEWGYRNLTPYKHKTIKVSITLGIKKDKLVEIKMKQK